MSAASANTLYLNGTEYCEVAKDSAALLALHPEASPLVYLSQNCNVKPGALPRKGMEDELVAAAKNCAATVGEERWALLKARWKEVAAARPAAELRAPEDDPLVGAFCEAIKRGKPNEPLTFLHFAHGTAGKEQSLAGKSGQFSLAELDYPGAALWAVAALAPKDRRLVSLHENCYGETFMSEMMFGPRQDFAAYRPSTCGVAAVSHDRLLSFEVTKRRRYVGYDNGAGCVFDAVPVDAQGTFMRNLERFPKKPRQTPATYARDIVAKPGQSMNLPVTSSASLLGLYYDRYAADPKRGVSVSSCVFDAKTAVPELLAAGASTLFFEEAARIKKEYLRVRKKVFGGKAAGSNELADVDAAIAALESENPRGELSEKYLAMNGAFLELDARHGDFDRLCGASVTPPSCQIRPELCTVKQLRESCRVRPPLTVPYGDVCDKIAKAPKLADSLPLTKLLARRSCASRALDCLTDSDVSKELRNRGIAYDRVNERVEKLRYLRRLGKSINGMDLIAAHLASGDADQALEARAAMQAYLGMIECERKGIFR